jgi:hypothetical protein
LPKPCLDERFSVVARQRFGRATQKENFRLSKNILSCELPLGKNSGLWINKDLRKILVSTPKSKKMFAFTTFTTWLFAVRGMFSMALGNREMLRVQSRNFILGWKIQTRVPGKNFRLFTINLFCTLSLFLCSGS